MDWNKIISEIKATGMTQAEIAASIGVAAGTLSELCSGIVKEPRWSRGDALIALYKSCCQAPMKCDEACDSCPDGYCEQRKDAKRRACDQKEGA